MRKRDPWVVIDLMTSEHLARFSDEFEALKFASAHSNPCDVRYWR